MSEQDEDRPLTRRERRLREMGPSPETAPVTEDAAAQAPVGTPDQTVQGQERDEATNEGSAPSAEPSEPVTEPDISLYDEDGNPRTRRELRRLRDEALAAAAVDAEPESTRIEERPETESLEAEPEAEPELEAESEHEVEHEADAEIASEVIAEDDAEGETVDAEASGAEPLNAFPDPTDTSSTEQEGSAPAFDDLLAPTEQYSVADLQEAVSSEESEDASDAAEPTAEPAEPETLDETEAVSPPEPKRRRLWRRNRPQAATNEVDTDQVDAEESTGAETEPQAAESEASLAGSEAENVSEAAAEDLTASEAEPEAQPLPVIEPDVPLSAAANDDEAPADSNDDAPTRATGYSFPDIVPPEEPRPVLDNPASHGMQEPATEASGTGDDFDDLISRAVAQEGTAGSSGTAALILPSMPEGEGYSGSLGETGELFVTGSIDLPKSLGETGGHVGVHESVDNDALEELGLVHADNHDSGPVSARSAVSARTTKNSSPLVAETTKEKSKLPMMLSLTGGGLLIAIAAAAAWAFSQGFFG